MAITTTDRVKTKTQLDDSYDDAIDLLIPFIEDEIVEYCNFYVDPVNGATIPPTMELIAIDMIHFRLTMVPGVKYSSVGSLREQYVEDYPPYILKRLKKYRTIMF